MASTTKRLYYALQWLAGKGVTTTHRIPYGSPGGPAERVVPYCNVISFPSRGARDRWVEGGSSFVRGRDYREPSSTKSLIVAAALRRARRDPWSGAVTPIEETWSWR